MIIIKATAAANSKQPSNRVITTSTEFKKKKIFSVSCAYGWLLGWSLDADLFPTHPNALMSVNLVISTDHYYSQRGPIYGVFKNIFWQFDRLFFAFFSALLLDQFHIFFENFLFIKMLKEKKFKKKNNNNKIKRNKLKGVEWTNDFVWQLHLNFQKKNTMPDKQASRLAFIYLVKCILKSRFTSQSWTTC